MVRGRDRCAEAGLPDHWKAALKNRTFLWVSSGMVVYLLLFALCMHPFLAYIEHRQGITLSDPVLSLITARNVSNWIFSVLYGSIVVVLVTLMPHPGRLLRFFMAIAMVYSLRCFTLYCVPLAPPAGCIPLADPLVSVLTGSGGIIVKDLFFSGHTACMFLLVLAVQNRYLMWGLLVALAGVIFLLLVQHAHYMIDIFGALILTPLCWKAGGLLCARLFKNERKAERRAPAF